MRHSDVIESVTAKETAMLLLLRFTGQKKLASVLGLFSAIAGLALGVVHHNHVWLFTALLGAGASFLRTRHQRREAAGAARHREPGPHGPGPGRFAAALRAIFRPVR